MSWAPYLQSNLSTSPDIFSLIDTPCRGVKEVSNLSQSCQWVHQIHRSRAVFLLYTGHQHAQNLFVGELVVPFPVDFEGAWPSSMLNAYRGGGGRWRGTSTWPKQ